MNNLLIFSDLHILEKDLDECSLVTSEIISLADKFKVDTVISLGDNFNNINPNPIELNFLANFINKLENRQIILLAAQSHESINKELSVLDHYGILNNNVKVVKEYIDRNLLYCGHFYVKESLKGKYGTTISKEQLKQYRQCYLGHQHSFQIIKPNTCQLGSCRFINFDEIESHKTVAIIENYEEHMPKTSFIALSSPYPMKVYHLSTSSSNPPENNLYHLNIGSLKAELDQLSLKTKVKVIIEDFSSFKEFISFEVQYKSKFVKFIRENKFELSTQIYNIESKRDTKIKPELEKYLADKKIDKEICNILLTEIK